ncbi:MAG: aminotransferase class I/II-fold pyridoxal phosphate-dependent enzyme [Planctomycetota bacterium]
MTDVGAAASNRRVYLSPPHMSGEELSLIGEVFDSNWIAPVGPHLDEFEQRLADYVGVEHALAVASGTAALHLALRHLRLEPGDDVLCSTLTFCASANPIVYEGANPVFIDSEASSWNIDPNLVAEELAYGARRGKLPRAIVAVDIFGQSANIEAINELAARYEIPVIEDAAEALGSTYQGRPVGSQAWASFFSFNGNKILTCSGGGVLCSNDTALIEQARFLATQARDAGPHYQHSSVGYNYRMSNVLAAVGLGQLSVLDDRVRSRRRNFNRYFEVLSTLAGLSFMPEVSQGCSNRWLTVIQIDSQEFGRTPEEIRLRLERQNIESRPVWKPLHMQPVFSQCRARGGEVAEKIFRNGLCLPSGSALTEQDLRRVVETIAEASTNGRISNNSRMAA